jgi:hypothetical protein
MHDGISNPAVTSHKFTEGSRIMNHNIGIWLLHPGDETKRPHEQCEQLLTDDRAARSIAREDMSAVFHASHLLAKTSSIQSHCTPPSSRVRGLRSSCSTTCKRKHSFVRTRLQSSICKCSSCKPKLPSLTCYCSVETCNSGCLNDSL